MTCSDSSTSRTTCLSASTSSSLSRFNPPPIDWPFSSRPTIGTVPIKATDSLRSLISSFMVFMSVLIPRNWTLKPSSTRSTRFIIFSRPPIRPWTLRILRANCEISLLKPWCSWASLSSRATDRSWSMIISSSDVTKRTISPGRTGNSRPGPIRTLAARLAVLEILPVPISTSGAPRFSPVIGWITASLGGLMIVTTMP